ncbi:hypothetical protein I7V34_07140 [Bacillus sp. V3]|nr:hypothetical protein I7V34_07140 [Bacillus sp. V3]
MALEVVLRAATHKLQGRFPAFSFYFSKIHSSFQIFVPLLKIHPSFQKYVPLSPFIYQLVEKSFNKSKQAAHGGQLIGRYENCPAFLL